jgi:hypothetical protein
MARKVFYSFHYKPDNWRVSTVRQIGAIEGNKTATDNDWEKITDGDDAKIEKWIKDQMIGKSCAIVLIGEKTAGRKWINYEINHAWNSKKGVLGIYINKLKNSKGEQSNKGSNPFDKIVFKGSDKKLSSVAKVYNPAGSTSTEVYNSIKENVVDWIEEAIKIRNAN